MTCFQPKEFVPTKALQLSNRKVLCKLIWKEYAIISNRIQGKVAKKDERYGVERAVASDENNPDDDFILEPELQSAHVDRVESSRLHNYHVEYYVTYTIYKQDGTIEQKSRWITDMELDKMDNSVHALSEYEELRLQE